MSVAESFTDTIGRIKRSLEALPAERVTDGLRRLVAGAESAAYAYRTGRGHMHEARRRCRLAEEEIAKAADAGEPSAPRVERWTAPPADVIRR